MGTMGKMPGTAFQNLDRPEKYYPKIAEFQARLDDAHDPRERSAAQVRLSAVKQALAAAEQQHGYKLDNQGRPIKPPTVQPVAAANAVTPLPRLVSDGRSADELGPAKSLFDRIAEADGTKPGVATAGPAPSQAEIDAEKAKTDATANAQAEADAIAEAKKQRDTQRKKRGFGLGAFLTGGWQSATGNALSKVLGV